MNARKPKSVKPATEKITEQKEVSQFSDLEILRQKTEQILGEGPSSTAFTLTVAEARKLIYELEIHQLELELQNEELRKAKEKAEDATEKYAELYDFSPSGYFTLSKEGEIIELNLQGAQMLGRERSDLKYRRFILFVSDTTKPVFNRFLNQVFNSKYKETCELILLSDCNLPTDVQLTGRVTDNGTHCLVTATDISELKLAEKANKQSEEQFQLLFNNAARGYQSLDSNGNFIEVNQQWLNTLGYTREEVIGKWFGDFLTPAYRDGFRKRFPILKVQGHIYSEFEMVHKNGDELSIAFEGMVGYNSKGEFKQTHCILQDITGRKKAEKAQRDSEEKLRNAYLYARSLIEANPDPLVTINIDGKITDVNSATENATGLSRNYLINTDFSDYFTEHDKAEIGYQKVFEHGCVIDYPLTIRHSSGRLIDVLYNASVYRDEQGKILGVFAAARDITEREQVQQVLRESEEKYRFLFTNNPQPMWIYDIETLAFLEVNEAAINHYGYSREEFLSMTIKDIRFAEDIPALLKDIEQTCEAYNRAGERRHIRKNGEVIFVEISSHAVISNGRMARHVLVSDITARKRTEAEIRSKNEELQRNSAEKDKFFSIIAHDLRSPFNGFLGLTELMAEGLTRMTLDDIQKIALLMRSSATSLFRLLGNLLEWSRMQRGLTTFVPLPILLKPKILESLALAIDAANKKGVAINFELPEELTIFVDENMFDGIIRNLVFNAVKFTPKGGCITISADAVCDNFVEISISDTGIGMDQNMIDHLFRLDINTNRKGTDGELSTGLGLMICKDFIEKHGGTLSVISKVGKGSTFRFTLPAKNEI